MFPDWSQKCFTQLALLEGCTSGAKCDDPGSANQYALGNIAWPVQKATGLLQLLGVLNLPSPGGSLRYPGLG